MMIANMEDLHGELSVLLFQSDDFQEQSALFVDDCIVHVKASSRSRMSVFRSIVKRSNVLVMNNGLKIFILMWRYRKIFLI